MGIKIDNHVLQQQQNIVNVDVNQINITLQVSDAPKKEPKQEGGDGNEEESRDRDGGRGGAQKASSKWGCCRGLCDILSKVCQSCGNSFCGMFTNASFGVYGGTRRHFAVFWLLFLSVCSFMSRILCQVNMKTTMDPTTELLYSALTAISYGACYQEFVHNGSRATLPCLTAYMFVIMYANKIYEVEISKKSPAIQWLINEIFYTGCNFQAILSFIVLSI